MHSLPLLRIRYCYAGIFGEQTSLKMNVAMSVALGTLSMNDAGVGAGSDPMVHVRSASMTSEATVDRLTRAIRQVQDSLPNSKAPEDVSLAAAAALEQAAALLQPYRYHFTQSADWSVGGGERGVRSLSPELLNPQWQDQGMQAGIVFTNFFHGANGAAHGGSIPLIFDEIFGRLSTAQGQLRRTAYLKVDFRSVTPVNKELTIEGHLERSEGRKFWFRGTIRDGEIVCAEADGLWVALKPGAM